MKYEEKDTTDEMKKQLKTWFQSISNPQFSLIDGLIQMFIDKPDDKVLQGKILKVLKKLNEHLPDTVGKQFNQNAQFPPSLVSYLEKTDISDLAGDAFTLLINIFDDKNADIYSEEFV